MKKEAQCILTDLSETAELCERASSRFPRMSKEITMRSSYYSAKGKKHPCAETLLKLEIDCSLLKLGIIIGVGLIVLWTFCSLKRKHRTS